MEIQGKAQFRVKGPPGFVPSDHLKAKVEETAQLFYFEIGIWAEENGFVSIAQEKAHGYIHEGELN